MKTINVVAAIIIDTEKIFATQRGCGEFKDGWEFPSAKIKNETSEDAVVREIKEELDSVDWLPAEQGLIVKIREYLKWLYPKLFQERKRHKK